MSYAIVQIAGKQIRVVPKKHCYAPKLAEKAGSQITFHDVLLIEDEKGIDLGAPTLGATIQGKVVDHGKSKKVIIFKKKRRKGYKVKKGHRQEYTKVYIESIKRDTTTND